MDYPEVLAEKNAKAQQTTQASDTSETTAASNETAAAETVEIKITDSDDSAAVAKKLYEAGLVDSESEFKSYISSEGKDNSLKSGTIQITKGSSDAEILKLITK